ncbi:MAG: putative ABC transporter permease [Bacteroidales bacterium]|nr:putative ABC transporter permease [Lachnoclostridium sp.]MCM1383553.1 putative ABC transporter permease [Lachnoclostridium sp.]MCM1464164.1 putative ABC transporter permease [Bacteroidales bacterium]
MWTKEMFGTDVYHLVAAFVIYSIIGWLVESIYMSFCNHKVTNRGFGKGPFCPIYGFGAVIGYLLLSPLKGHYVKIYLVGAVLATMFEYLVGRGMIRFLGELWWDYNEKPFNYQGIICLESTVAWGFYAIGVVQFLQDRVYHFIDRFSISLGIRLLEVILFAVAVDYAVQLVQVFDIDVREKRDRFVERCQSFIARWY